MEQNGFSEVREHDRCPGCGSTEREAESLAQGVRDRGLMDPDFPFYFESIMKVVEQPDKTMALMPIGGRVPVLMVHEDICKGCGVRYAVRVEHREVEKRKAVDLELPPSAGPFGSLRGN